VSPDSDARRVPAREGRGEVRGKASRFFGIAARIAAPREAEERLAAWRREFHDATHVAFAWKISVGDAAATRASNAGEPPGSAGRPILGKVETPGPSESNGGTYKSSPSPQPSPPFRGARGFLGEPHCG
jgi:putative IMPACT (imprinted ancient) family translation regulator